MLGFSEDDKFSLRELRHAYFEAAKRYHPDVIAEGQDLEFDFKDVTDAYEHLLSGDSNDDTTPQYSKEEMDNIVTLSEEEEYRQACRDQLGLPAEIVEESKKNPMFRKWLTGNTDAAHYWRMFLTGHGGLAQKLRPQQYLSKGEVAAPKKSETRRKKKSTDRLVEISLDCLQK